VRYQHKKSVEGKVKHTSRSVMRDEKLLYRQISVYVSGELVRIL